MDSLITWVGGKKQLREIIASKIPDDIKSYIEVFGGAGWVLFYKDRWALKEVYNDLDERLTNLFKIAKFHPEALRNELKLMIHSRSLFNDIREQPGITDLQQAARFFYLIKRSFGAKGGQYGRARNDSAAKSLQNMIKHIEDVSKRLDRVEIENQDYKSIFDFYDNPDAFFFCDPPYRIGAQYKTGRMDYKKFYEAVTELKARFLITLDDCPQNIDLFKKYNITKVKRINGINRKHIKNNFYHEIIITNY